MQPIDFTRYLRQEGNTWVFEVWDCVPGPCGDDFTASFSTYETALQAVQNYLHGTPTIISDWPVPLHRHPELQPTEVQQAIIAAVHITRDEFESIAQRRRERIYNYWYVHRNTFSQWDKLYQSTFLTIPHVQNSAIILQLRRDAQESYIVGA